MASQDFISDDDAKKLSVGDPYAEGGNVSGFMPFDEERMFADGGESAPDFIPDSQFNSSPESQPQVVNQAQNQTPSPDFIPDDQFKSDDELRSDKYGSLGQMAKTAIEGAGRGLVGPLAPLAETSLGVKPEDIRGRAEENPIIAGASEVGGFLAPLAMTGGASSLTQMGALSKVGNIAEKLGLVAGDTLASKIGVTAAKGAIDNMLLTGSDEVSRMILQDPSQSAQTAITDIGLSGVIGGALGGGLGGVSHLLDGAKASKTIADFKGRINEHINNPNPELAMTTELSDFYKHNLDLADKLQAPETTIEPPSSIKRNDNVFTTRSSKAKPRDFDAEALATSKQNAAISKASQEAFEDYAPALKDFENKFTAKVGDARQVDPQKISTYLNQLGKPNAEIKQSILRNFIDASNDYRKSIDNIHAKYDLSTPVSPTPMTTTMASLGEKTLGSKMADAFIKKGLTDAGGETLGATVGATLGHVAGLPGAIGAIIGSHALGPFFKSVLPGIAKRLVTSPVSSQGFRQATEFGNSVSKGSDLLTKAAKHVFKLEESKLPESIMPTEKDRSRLDKQLKEIQKNPSSLMDNPSSLDHYMPDHAMAMNETLGAVISHLNALRASQDRKAPLDSIPIPSSTQKASYENALNIAQQPLIVLDKIRNGTLTANDIQHMGAMYPALAKSMQERLTDEMVEATKKGQTIPYKTRIGLSLFMGQPMDSSMSPTSIIAAQPLPKQAPQPTQQPQSKGTKSSPALQKMPSMYQTPSQNRQAQRQKQD